MLFDTVGVAAADVEDELPGNPVEEFKSCGCVNPSTDRLALPSKTIQ